MKYLLILMIALRLGACDAVPPADSNPSKDTPVEVTDPKPPEVRQEKSDGIEALHLPAQNPAGVLILLHGYGSNPADIIELGRRLRSNWEIWAPRAPIEVRDGHYAWFDLQFDEKRQVKRGNEEAALAEWNDKLHAFALSKKRERRPLVLAGFSQGAAVSMILATRDTPEISGVASLSGWLPATRELIHPNREYFVAHGDKDTRIDVEAAQNLRSRLNGDRTRFRIYTGMRHTVSTTVLDDMRKWLETITKRPEFN